MEFITQSEICRRYGISPQGLRNRILLDTMFPSECNQIVGTKAYDADLVRQYFEYRPFTGKRGRPPKEQVNITS